jgi:uracil-DNA glycosylase family 4
MFELGDEMKQLYEEVKKCTLCPLSRSRTNAVPGEGPEDAKVIFIGEAPGFHEDQQGRPFVGAAGHFLDELLASIQMARRDVYIANVVKCRPPGNRDPQPNEMEICTSHYLDRQLALIKPRLIVTLGRYSMERYFPGAKISAVHGRAKSFGSFMVLPLYHPAAALHQPRYRSDIETDFQKIPNLLKEAVSLGGDPGPSDPMKAEQLNLF